MSEKTQIYNLVILDRSGSMNSMRQAALDGFNETLAGIKAAQIKYSDTQTHFISLLSFCSCRQDYTYDKVSAQNADPLQLTDYVPCCRTPLYDAMGQAITSLESYVKDIPDYSVIVTIITDGRENSSRTFTSERVKALVNRLQKDGWNFTYMGANQDSVFVGKTLGITQVRNYQATSMGMRAAYEQDRRQRATYFEHVHRAKHKYSSSPAMSASEQRLMYSKLAADSYMEAEQTSASPLVTSPYSNPPASTKH